MREEHRIRIDFVGRRTRYYSKKTLAFAQEDRAKLLTAALEGRLAPYWNGAVLTIESSPVQEWRTDPMNDPVELVIAEKTDVQEKLSLPIPDTGSESEVRPENGEELRLPEESVLDA